MEAEEVDRNVEENTTKKEKGVELIREDQTLPPLISSKSETKERRQSSSDTNSDEISTEELDKRLSLNPTDKMETEKPSNDSPECTSNSFPCQFHVAVFFLNSIRVLFIVH